MSERHQLTDPAAVREFVFAGNARLTLVSRKTGARFTYRVRASDSTSLVSHFVSVLTGSDNESDYSYLGFFRDGAFHHGRKSRISREAPSAAAWAWFADTTLYRSAGAPVPRHLEVWTEGRCGRCNRVLTDPTSIARGIGPECVGRM